MSITIFVVPTAKESGDKELST